MMPDGLWVVTATLSLKRESIVGKAVTLGPG